MTETKNILCITDITRELEFCYPNKDFTSYTDEALREFFQKHVSSNSIEIAAGEILNEVNSFILIDTPDGYQPIGDFYIKKHRDIYHLTLSNGYECKSSCDHLYETEFGWKKAKDLTKNDAVLTKQGFFKVISCTQISNEEVYDWEVLHENHRYWAGAGISSHNTGKTFLTLNACREAQKMGYSIIYCDSEAAVDEDIIKNFGVNPEKFRYQPVSTPLEVRHFVANLCDTLKKAKEKGTELPKIMLVLDSLGNLATHKERTDAMSGSEKKDMTKQQELRSLFRVITTDLAEMKIPFLLTNHTYASIGSFFPGQTIAGGGGAIYNASVILQLSKAGLKEGDNDAAAAGIQKTGIIVTSKAAKNRFARPIPVKFHISFYKGMNPYVGLESFINWENCGIQKGKILSEKDFNKWYVTPNHANRAAVEATKFFRTEEDGTQTPLYFEARETARTVVVRHLAAEIKPAELFTSKVITDEVLRELDEKVIKKMFMLPNIADLNELEDMEIETDILDKIETDED
jgi:RecA/RadA recombinase